MGWGTGSGRGGEPDAAAEWAQQAAGAVAGQRAGRGGGPVGRARRRAGGPGMRRRSGCGGEPDAATEWVRRAGAAAQRRVSGAGAAVGHGASRYYEGA